MALKECIRYIRENLLISGDLIDNEILYTKDDYKNITTINTELENRLYDKKVLTSK